MSYQQSSVAKNDTTHGVF